MGTSSNAHTLVKEQLEDHLNRHKNLAQLIHILHETFIPLVSISKLPSIPHLYVVNQVSVFILNSYSVFKSIEAETVIMPQEISVSQFLNILAIFNGNFSLPFSLLKTYRKT